MEPFHGEREPHRTLRAVDMCAVHGRRAVQSEQALVETDNHKAKLSQDSSDVGIGLDPEPKDNPILGDLPAELHRS